MSSPISLILGTSSIGDKGTPTSRIHTVQDAQKLVDIFVSAGGHGFDTSNIYGGTTTEGILSKLDIKTGPLNTKIFPMQAGAHAPEQLRAAVEKSASTLSPHKVDILFLHAPDRSVPFVDTLKEINELHKRGLFKEFGLSNFLAWEVSEFHNIAKERGWVAPTIYQGLYNAIERRAESELFPCLRKYGIRFQAYSPLAAGLLAGKSLEKGQSDGSRFDAKNTWIADVFTKQYTPLVDSVTGLQDFLAGKDLDIKEVAFRWLHHHSALKLGDAIILGAGSLDQLEKNLKANEGGPLPDDVVSFIEEVWKKNVGAVPSYVPAF